MGDKNSGYILILQLTSTSIKIMQKIIAHKACVRKTIEIKDGRLISCSWDKTIKIWKFDNNQYILENTLNQYSKSRFSSILDLNNNIIVSTPFLNGSIVFWNIKQLEIIFQFKKLDCSFCWNSIKKLSNKLFIVGGINSIYLFSILNYKLLNKIKIDSECSSICCLSDGNILTGHKNGKIKQYNLINNELKFIGENKYHEKYITVIVKLKRDLILCGSYDCKINIYKNE